MTAFLSGSELSARVRALLQAEEPRCAVAFWGNGAAKELFSGDSSAHGAKIVCDVSMGGTHPDALKALGAPKNPNLKHLVGLHAKVYLSRNGLVVTSANASNNGLGFGGNSPSHVEAGVAYDAASTAWHSASEWFNRLFEEAETVNDAAVFWAERTWRPDRVTVQPRIGSLIDAVRLAPERFSDIAFYFEKVPLQEAEAKQIRDSSLAQPAFRSKQKVILDTPTGEIFSGLSKREVSDTPQYLLEFWQSGTGRLRIFARHAELRDVENGVIYTIRCERRLRNILSGNLPSLKEASKLDGEIANMLLVKRRWGTRFLSAAGLVEALNGLR